MLALSPTRIEFRTGTAVYVANDPDLLSDLPLSRRTGAIRQHPRRCPHHQRLARGPVGHTNTSRRPLGFLGRRCDQLDILPLKTSAAALGAGPNTAEQQLLLAS